MHWPPAVVFTDFFLRLVVTAWSLKNEWNDMAANIPLTRVGTPEDAAGTALFLASRAGAYVNGASIIPPSLSLPY